MTKEQQEESPQPLFALGQVVATPGALDTLRDAGIDPLVLLARHVTGDWGELSEEDIEANREALAQGYRLLSAYPLETGERLWIITEWDRSATTLLRPDEY